MEAIIYTMYGITFGGLLLALVFSYFNMDKVSKFCLTIGRFTGVIFTVGLLSFSFTEVFIK